MEGAFCFADEIDPLKAVHPHSCSRRAQSDFPDRQRRLRTGDRWRALASDVSNEEAFRLARAMKNAAAGFVK